MLSGVNRGAMCGDGVVFLMDSGPVIFFDGVCGLCNRGVRFVVRRDRRGYFRFAALQGALAEQMLRPRGIDPATLESFVLLENGQTFTQSDAVLEVVRQLDGAWPALRIFRWVPRGLRDAAYRFVARHRYRWFGRFDTCPAPSPELRARLLQD